jgi:hypothetical protein
LNVVREGEDREHGGYRVLREASVVRPWASIEESQAFAQRFSKALVESLVRGDGAVAVWIEGEVVWQTRR